MPFLLLGGTAYAEGVGELLTPLPAVPGLRMMIVKGTESVSTPAAYKAIDALESPVHPDTAAMLRAVRTGDAALLKKSCGNLFEQAIDCADVTRAKQRLLECGAEYAVMTGSGAAVFGIFPEEMPESAFAAALGTLAQEFAFARRSAPTDKPFLVIKETL